MCGLLGKDNSRNGPGMMKPTYLFTLCSLFGALIPSAGSGKEKARVRVSDEVTLTVSHSRTFHLVSMVEYRPLAIPVQQRAC